MLVLISSVIEHDARYVQFQDAFRIIGNVTLGRTRTDIITSRTSFCALCGQVASKEVSEHFYLKMVARIRCPVRCGFVRGVRNVRTSHSLT